MVGKYFENLWKASVYSGLNTPRTITEFAVLILVHVLFFLTLQKALRRCSVPNRTMSPGLVWLQWIPFFNLVWQFFVVKAVSQSLENEFRSRGIYTTPRPGQSLGVARCVLQVCGFLCLFFLTLRVFRYGLVPLLGLSLFIVWIVYWVKIADLSRQLAVPAGMYGSTPSSSYPSPPPPQPTEPKLLCSQCGAPMGPTDRTCCRCGAAATQLV